MKNLARLALFFSISFVLLFLFLAILKFLGLWIDAARLIPVTQEQSGALIAALTRTIPAALYISILLSLSYTARRHIPYLLSMVAIMVLAAVFVLGAALGIRRLGGVDFAVEAAPAVREQAGLILSRQDISMVLLKEGGDLWGPRVVAIPGQSMLYQESPRGPNNSSLTLPALPFRDETPWFIQSISIDFNLSSRQFEARLRNGLIPFFMYVGALIFLLSSFRFLMEASRWPLSNLFLGALVFRGVLSLETFLNGQEILGLLSSFLGRGLSQSQITPLFFAAAGCLILLYTLLARLAKGRPPEND
ncbi:MAG: hypothetical protein LBF78_09970 [Treponema sp.]|jgi:hypothetical protein|nr:hypothetical protein [Treponema sp.]